jgi:hypothetical protein
MKKHIFFGIPALTCRLRPVGRVGEGRRHFNKKPWITGNEPRVTIVKTAVTNGWAALLDELPAVLQKENQVFCDNDV